MSGDRVPIGRRVAYLRARRRLSQQTLADRLGKSKSWVDKVERGVRRLERVPTIREIAAVLRVDAATLLGRDAQPAGVVERDEDVARIRAALSAYDIGRDRPASVLPVDRVARHVGYAWTVFQHARYPQVVELLPSLLGDVQRTCARDPAAGRAVVVVVVAYRLTAALLVKLDETDLAWLAADRAMAAAAGDPVLVAGAAVQLGQVLRSPAQARSVLLAAAYRIALSDLDAGTAGELSLCGALLVQAGLVSARCGDERVAGDLLDEAAELAARVDDGVDLHRTAFGPTVVELARVAAAVELGDGSTAVARHRQAIRRNVSGALEPETGALTRGQSSVVLLVHDSDGAAPAVGDAVPDVADRYAARQVEGDSPPAVQGRDTWREPTPLPIEANLIGQSVAS